MPKWTPRDDRLEERAAPNKWIALPLKFVIDYTGYNFTGDILKKVSFISILLLLFYSVASAGWSEDVRLTYGNHGSMPEIIARGDTVHVAFAYIAPIDSIFYLKSINGGITWEQAVSLQGTEHLGSKVDLNLWGGELLEAWNDIDTSNINWAHNIAFGLKMDSSMWSAPYYVFHPFLGADFSDFAIEIVGESLYVVYTQLHTDSTGYWPIKFLRSADLGNAWNPEVTIGHLSSYTNPLSMKYCGNNLYIVWSGDFPPDFLGREVHGLVSSDGGRSWSEHFLISSNDSYVAQHSCIACDEENGNFVVGWMDYALSQGFPGDVFVRLTTDGGQSWDEIRDATIRHTSSDPSIAIRGDSLYAVWCDNDTVYGYPNSEICFTRSTNLGESWDRPLRLTYAEGYSYTPWISYDMGRLHVAWWEELRPPHYGDEVYYKRFDPEPDGIRGEVGGMLPKAPSLSAYPNPFNSATTITITGAEQAELGIYDITGRKIATLKTENGRTIWDATGYSSGLYFAVLERGNQSAKLTLIK